MLVVQWEFTCGEDAGGCTGAAPALYCPGPYSCVRHCMQARMVHLMRTVPHEALAAHMRRTDAAMWRGAAAVPDLPPGVGEYGADMEGPDKACSTLGRHMMLPLHHGGLELRMQSDEASDAAIVAGVGKAERNLKGHPALPSARG